MRTDYNISATLKTSLYLGEKNATPRIFACSVNFKVLENTFIYSYFKHMIFAEDFSLASNFTVNFILHLIGLLLF